MRKLSLLEQEGIYKVLGLSEFENTEFSQSSGNHYLPLPKAIAYCNTFNGHLQSAREVALFRIAANKKDNADDHQSNRTIAITFVKDGMIWKAYDDSPNPEENILLARNEEAQKILGRGEYWKISRNDPLVDTTIKRAMVADRIAPAQESTVLSLPLDGTYSNNANIRGVLTTVAPLYERFLSGRHCQIAYLYDCTASEYKERGVDNETTRITRVGMGGGDYPIDVMDIGGLLYPGGRARAVREKF